MGSVGAERIDREGDAGSRCRDFPLDDEREARLLRAAAVREDALALDRAVAPLDGADELAQVADAEDALVLARRRAARRVLVRR